MTVQITLERDKPLSAQPDKGHNRWHPDIPPLAEVEPGEEVLLDTLDAVLNMIEHLRRTYGYSEGQAYHLCSVAVNLKISQGWTSPTCW
jgi:acetamidase/formamidase